MFENESYYTFWVISTVLVVFILYITRIVLRIPSVGEVLFGNGWQIDAVVQSIA